MFRFLTDRYPLIMQRLDEEHVFDNFYLDMNGIIHQCTHPDDDAIAVGEDEEMFARIFEYTDRLYKIVSPRCLMFLAVDGVAPRAKMNQQRSRRFRSAKDAERAMAEAIARGDEIPSGVPFDSNCITPGTSFMYQLSIQFRSWIDYKMKSDPAWQQGCTVVFSGSEVPGEGEHKIMDYIRAWKKSEHYSAQVRHCMYGLDADLMMLGLVTHAPRFTLLRERLRYSKNGRRTPQMTGTASDADEFHLLELSMLRDMLFLEFKRSGEEVESEQGLAFTRPGSRRSRQDPRNLQPSNPLSKRQTNSSKYQASRRLRVDASRIVDDFVFMCMLVGNDFLPNIPHLDIAEGGINIMFRVYKQLLPEWGGYLTDRHRLHPDRLESFLARVCQGERSYFEHRAQTDDVSEYKTEKYRQAYYREKFGFDVEGSDGEYHLQRLRQAYMEGLHWVLQYYHNGVSSWNWYYPDFYAALGSDMVRLRSIRVQFKKGRPFRPLTQLMAVLPPESAAFLPGPMRELMIGVASPVLDFYPSEFVTDQNGKRNPWEAVVVIPFIEEERLLRAIRSINPRTDLTEEERERNKFGSEHWFYADDYPLIDYVIPPVRPSKFRVAGSPARSRSSSPRSSSRSQSPTRSSLSSRSATSEEQYNRSRSPSATSSRSEDPSGRGGRSSSTRSSSSPSSRSDNSASSTSSRASTFRTGSSTVSNGTDASGSSRSNARRRRSSWKRQMSSEGSVDTGETSDIASNGSEVSDVE